MPCKSFDAQGNYWGEADSQRTQLPCRLETLASRLEASTCRGKIHRVVLPGTLKQPKLASSLLKHYPGLTIVIRLEC